ncbi:MAG: hypothetical protein RR212_00105 [Bacteroidales bacterium]
MSCPTWAHFENLKEGTRKRVYINLGWIPPSDFELSVILVNASKEVNETFEWERLTLPVHPGFFMAREKFEEMKRAVEGINGLTTPSLRMHYRNLFTLKKAWEIAEVEL